MPPLLCAPMLPKRCITRNDISPGATVLVVCALMSLVSFHVDASGGGGVFAFCTESAKCKRSCALLKKGAQQIIAAHSKNCFLFRITNVLYIFILSSSGS